MNDNHLRQPKRDMDITIFGETMAALSDRCYQIELAVFFDASGETIDYHSYRDLFVTRLAAAHHGLIFQSVLARLKWLGMGKLEMIEICARDLDSVTVPIGDDLYLTVMTEKGAIDSEFHDALGQTVLSLKKEAGLEPND